MGVRSHRALFHSTPLRHHPRTVKHNRRLTSITLAAASLATVAQVAPAQSLRGSHASVSLMYRSAVNGGMNFYETTADLKRAVLRGELVALPGNASYEVSRVRTPYVRPETRTYVLELAADYRDACGEPMVITSATRPMSRKLVNSSSLSVHPTGIAVDLRKPQGRCLTWLRKTLLAAERKGSIEATEERHPAHFHVAVLPTAYGKVAARTRSASSTRTHGGR
jgi:uncharacterized protein DUF5715